MRKLAPSEKTLFFVLCGAVFLALNLFSLKLFLNMHRVLQSKISTLNTQLAEGRSVIMMAEMLQPATTWIHQHPLPNWNNDQASAELLKCERNEAEKAGLKIIEENLLPPHTSSYGSSVSVQAKISGSFDGLVKFLFALQNPTAWRAINKFTIKSDSEPTKVIVDLEIKQFFQTTSSR
ncbi:MAG: hypothetical protein ACOYK6_02345 [Chthoniobacterales bacterium]